MRCAAAVRPAHRGRCRKFNARSTIRPFHARRGIGRSLDGPQQYASASCATPAPRRCGRLVGAPGPRAGQRDGRLLRIRPAYRGGLVFRQPAPHAGPDARATARWRRPPGRAPAPRRRAGVRSRGRPVHPRRRPLRDRGAPARQQRLLALGAQPRPHVARARWPAHAAGRLLDRRACRARIAPGAAAHERALRPRDAGHLARPVRAHAGRRPHGGGRPCVGGAGL